MVLTHTYTMKLFVQNHHKPELDCQDIIKNFMHLNMRYKLNEEKG